MSDRFIGLSVVGASLVICVLVGASLIGSCAATADSGAGTRDGSPGTASSRADDQQEPTTLTSAVSDDADDDLLFAANQRWTGDFDGMVERRMIRALVPYSGTFYFLDGVEQRGITYEAMQQFETAVNDRLQRGHLKVYVVVIPVRRDLLIPALLDGRGDIAAGNLTITPARQELVDFSDPAYRGVDEIVVTGPASPPLSSIDDLAGQTVPARRSSSYWESLERLNASLRAAGKDEMTLEAVDERLEDEDLLEMVSAGLLPLAIIDSHKATFWGEVFDDIELHPEIAVNTDGNIGWAFRKNSPQLAATINEFVREHRQGTLMGNILLKRYLSNTRWVSSALDRQGRERFQQTIQFFQQYAGRYGFDWLMVAAQAYQESKLDQSLVSPVGAIGVMQLLPSTAADPNVDIPDIHEIENNIHAGVKYLRFIRDRYFADAGMDEFNVGLFSFAAYNAGPARISRLRREAEELGLDPNEWFDNVEVVAARRIGRETVQYVGNIFKYYVAYQRIARVERARQR